MIIRISIDKKLASDIKPKNTIKNEVVEIIK